MKPIAVIEAPSILGLRPTGVERLPQALLQAGLLDRLHARHGGFVAPEPYSDVRDPETGFLNPKAISVYTRRLADCVGPLIDSGNFPLVLGGDCSIVLGAMLALRRRARYGLLYLDGHMDFYNREANVNGEAASSDLALATGRGPELLTTYEGLRPLVRDEDVVALGFRDEGEAEQYGSQPLPREMKAMSLVDVRGVGVEHAAREAVMAASGQGSRGFWIHLDADVLDDAIMPAVDYRLPGGLSWGETRTVLSIALADRNAMGMELTIFNPTLDTDGRILEAFMTMLEGCFTR